MLVYQCMADGLRGFVQNYRFHPERKYEIDLAFPHAKVGIEINGGIFNAKAHGSIKGILRDMDKGNLLTLAGWRVLRFTPAQVKAGEAIEGLKQLLGRIRSETEAPKPNSVSEEKFYID